jgi:hypothetical protein
VGCARSAAIPTTPLGEPWSHPERVVPRRIGRQSAPARHRRVRRRPPQGKATTKETTEEGVAPFRRAQQSGGLGREALGVGLATRRRSCSDGDARRSAGLDRAVRRTDRPHGRTVPTERGSAPGEDPASIGSIAGVAQWQSPSLPSWSCGFDSRRPLSTKSELKGRFGRPLGMSQSSSSREDPTTPGTP